MAGIPPALRKHTVALALVILSILTATKFGLAQARPLPFSVAQKVHLSLHDKSFSEVIAALVKQLHCSIVVDDIPLTKVENIEFDVTAKEALDQIAVAYDYTWEMGKRGAILMRKRFHKPEEHPQVNLPEIRETIRNLNMILNFSNDSVDAYSQIALLNSLVASLVPDQRAALSSGHSLPMTTFNAPQQQLIQQAIASSFLSQAQLSWHQLEAQLNFISDARLRLDHNTTHTDILTGIRTDQPVLAYYWKGAEGFEHSCSLLHGATKLDLHPEK